MPVTPVPITPRFTMQDWIGATDCCSTVSRRDDEQHRMTFGSGQWITPTDISNYERIIPPMSAFNVGDIVRINTLVGDYTGKTGIIESIHPQGSYQSSDAIIIRLDDPSNIFPTASWNPAYVEHIEEYQRVYAPLLSMAASVPASAWQEGLADWERELLNYDPLDLAVDSAQIRRVAMTDIGNAVHSSAEAIVGPGNALTPQTEEDTQMNLAELTEKLVDTYVKGQGSTTSLLLDPKASRALGVDARGIKRSLKKCVESLSWQDRARGWYLRADKDNNGVMQIVSGTDWLNKSTFVDNLLPAVVPLKIALLVLKSALPEWVDIEANYNLGRIVVSTTKGEAFALTLGSELGASLGSFGVRGMDAFRFASALGCSQEFRKVAARRVFNTMKRIARQSIISKPSQSSTGNFDNFMSTLRSQRKTDEVILSRFIIPEHGLVSSRNWGIEVETAGARGVNTPAGWDSKGDGSLESAYSEDDEDNECEENHESQVYDSRNGRYLPNPDWTDELECDECIAYNERENSGQGYRDCREFVSPILHSFHSKGLQILVEEIMTQPQNNSAGIHVHVDASDLTPKQIGSLTYGYQIIEPLIEASYQRETREYCKARRNSEVLDVIRQAKESPSMKNREISTDTRYVALNLESLRAHGTVEFRAMGPVYDYEYLIRWAYVCRELVNVAKADISQGEWNAVDSFEKLAALFIRRGSESVDTQLSTITDEDISAMITKNRYNVNEEVYAMTSGEI